MPNSLLRWLLIIATPLLLSAALHEYYVSVTRANYNAASARLEISMKLFTDDLERTISINTGEVLKLSDADDLDAADEFFAQYLTERITLMEGSNLKELVYIGSEPGVDETWLYAEIEMPSRGEFMVKNTILFDVFPEQINIMHIKANNVEQSHYFNTDKPQIKISL